MTKKTIKALRRALIFLALAASAWESASAAPQQVLYQGTLRKNGSIYTGVSTFIFRITSADGLTQYWTSGSTVVAVNGGLFRYPLGVQNTGVDDGTFAAIPWGSVAPYIETSVDGSLMLPREALISVPYAMNAASAVDATKMLKIGDTMTGRLYVSSAGIVGDYGLLASTVTLNPLGAAPAGSNGMLYYNSGTNQLNVYENGWTPVATGSVGQWTTSGLNIYNANTGNVGIGSANPLSKLYVSSGNAVLDYGVQATTITLNPLASAPSYAVNGMLYYNSGTNQLNAYVNGGWVQISTGSLESLNDFTRKAGDSMTGQLTIAGSSLTVGTLIQAASGYFTSNVTASTMSVTGNAFSVGVTALAVSGGNVGLGSNNPLSRLYVSSGNAVLDYGVLASTMTLNPLGAAPNGSNGMLYYNSGTNQLNVYANGWTPLASGGVSGWTQAGLLAYTADNALVESTMTVAGNAFSVGVTTLVVSGGNVGIGTASPASKLHISSGTLYMDGTSPAVQTGVLNVGAAPYGYSTQAFLIMDQSGTTSRIYTAGGGGYPISMQNSAIYLTAGYPGNVGIATTIPATRLDVNDAAQFGSGATKSTFTATPGNGAYALQLSSGVAIASGPVTLGNSGFIQFADHSVQTTAAGAGAAYWGVNGTNVYDITGNVGIGTSNPGTKLHMSSGTLTMDGNNGTPFSVNNSTFVITSGNIGIGTTGPIAKLDIRGGGGLISNTLGSIPDVYGYNASNSNFQVYSQNSLGISANIYGAGSGAGWAGGIGLSRSNGSPGSETALANGDRIARIEFSGSTGPSAWLGGARIEATPEANWSAASAPTALGFLTTPSGATAEVERMRISNSGNVGIGTTSPGTKLHMSSGTLTIDGNNGTPFSVNNSTFVITSGMVGIGTSNPGAALDINSGTAWINPVVASNAGLQFRNGGVFKGSVGYISATNNVYFGQDGTTVQGINVNSVNQVGIGTIIPATLLDVNGSAQFGSGATKSTFTATPGNGTYALQLSSGVAIASGPVVLGNTGFIQYADGTVQTTAAGAGAAYWKVNGTSIYDNTGNVGIGTSNPGTKLHMSSGTLTIDGNNGTPFSVNNSTFVITSGNVGIGTTAPGYLLDAAGNARFTGGSTPSSYMDGSISVQDSLGLVARGNLNPGLNRWSLRVRGTGNDGDFDIYDAHNSLSRLLINSSGNVGLGTTSPGTKLHMSSGTLTIDGNAATAFQVGVSSFIVNASGQVLIGHAVTSGLYQGDVSIANGNYFRSLDAAGGNNVKLIGLDGSNKVRIDPSGQGAYFNGNVGLGTTSPAQTLDVNGSSQFGSGATKSTFTATPGNGTYALQLSSGVAIASGPVVLGNSGFIQFADHTVQTTAAGAGAAYWKANGTSVYDNIGNVGIGTSNPGTLLHMSSGTLTIDGNSGTPLSVNGSTFVITSGMVGIGTTNPATPLDVAGASTFRGIVSLTTQQYLSLISRYSGAYHGAIIYNNGSNNNPGLAEIATDRFGFGSFSGTPTSVALTPVMTLDISGNKVGIGTTNPGTLLHMSSGTLTIDGNNGAPFSVNNSTFVIASGMVGIGTTSPQAKLDVNQGAMRITGSAYNTKIAEKIISADARSGTDIMSDLSLNLLLADTNNGGGSLRVLYGTSDSSDNSKELFRITQSGNVGIGTTNPATALDVNGSAQFGSGATKSTFTATPGNGTYALQLSSGVAIASGPVVLGNSGFIQFADHTVQTTAAGAGAAYWKANGTSVYDNTGNVGIGTSNPGTLLHMSSGTLTIDGNAATAFQVGTSSFIINSSGNVGIGTTGPNVKLEVSGLGRFTGTSGLSIGSDIGQPRLQFNSPGFAFLNSANQYTPLSVRALSIGGNYGDDAAPTNGMIIEGNVGIGTSNPGSKLHMSSGTLTIDGNASTAFQVGVSSFIVNASGQVMIGHAVTSGLYTGDVSIANGNFFRSLDAAGGNNIKLIGLDASNKVRIDASGQGAYFNGNVGLGTTSPAQTLDVNGSSQFGSGATKSTFTATPGNGAYALQLSSGVAIASGPVVLGNSGFIRFADGSIQTSAAPGGGGGGQWNLNGSKMYYTGGGVGIGTTNPAYLLSVGDGVTAGDQVISVNVPAVNIAGFDLSKAGATKARIMIPVSSNDLAFADSGGATRVTFQTGGNVGIGTTSPGSKLHMSSGTLTIDGTSANANISGTITVSSITGSGSFSNPDSGPNSERWGSGARATGNLGPTALGYNASATGDRSTALGYQASASAIETVALGWNSSASAAEATAVGVSAKANQTGGVAVGQGSLGGYHAVGVGYTASSNGNESVALGFSAQAGYASSIALGANARATAANQMVIGNAPSNSISDIYMGDGSTTTAPGTYTLHATGGDGSNVAGGTLQIAGGQGTGTGAGGPIIFKTAAAGGSGSSLNALAEAMRVTSAGYVGIGTAGPVAKLEVKQAVGDTTVVQISSNNGVGMVVVNNQGYVGIGTTNPTGSMLVISANSNLAAPPNRPRIELIDTAGSGGDWSIQPFGAIGGDGNFAILRNNAAGNLLLAPNGSGNVGVGTYYPVTAFDVGGAAQFGSGATKSTFTATPGNGTYALQLSSGVAIASGPVVLGNTGFIQYADGTVQTTAAGAGAAYWKVNGTSIYDNTGNVGIGTTNPTDRFSVVFNAASARRALSLEDEGGAQTVLAPTGLGVANSYGHVGYNFYAASPSQLKYRGGINQASGIGFGGGINFWTAPSAAADAALTPGVAMTIANGGNVGIGTASPGTKLHMSSGTLTIDGNNGTPFSVNNSTFVITSGNVGIGTSNPSDGPLQVNSSVNAFSNVGSFINSNTGTAAITRVCLGTNGGDCTGQIVNLGGNYSGALGSGSEFQINNAVNAPLSLWTNNTNRVSITGAGNVGIGTTNPNYNLQVNGGAGGAVIQLTGQGSGTGATNGAYFSLSGALGNDQTNLQLIQTGNKDIEFHTNAGGSTNEKMRITRTGNVGIGTASPGTKLHMSSGTFTIDGNNGTPFSVNNSTFVITSGNVGIGTTNPIYTLEISKSAGGRVVVLDGSGTNSIYYQTSNTGRNLYLGSESSAGGNIASGSLGYAGVLATDGGGALQFAPGNFVSMTLLNGGNVGIGTVSPGTKLHMSSGTLTIDGNNNTPFSVNNSTFVISGGNVGIGTSNPSTGVGFTGPNQVLEIAGTAATVNAPVLILNRLATGQVGKWDIGVDSNKALTVIDETSSNLAPFRIFQGAATNSLQLQVSAVNIATHVIVSAGNVGIGTANPRTNLQIGDTSGAINMGGNATANGWTSLSFLGSNSVTNWRIAQNDIYSGDLEFIPSTVAGGSTFSTPAMQIASSGNVGIGTTNPGQSLEVNGGIRANTATAQPACSATTRGTFWFVQSGAGVKDNVQVCAKDNTDAYAWRVIY